MTKVTASPPFPVYDSSAEKVFSMGCVTSATLRLLPGYELDSENCNTKTYLRIECYISYKLYKGRLTTRQDQRSASAFHVVMKNYLLISNVHVYTMNIYRIQKFVYADCLCMRC